MTILADVLLPLVVYIPGEPVPFEVEARRAEREREEGVGAFPILEVVLPLPVLERERSGDPTIAPELVVRRLTEEERRAIPAEEVGMDELEEVVGRRGGAGV